MNQQTPLKPAEIEQAIGLGKGSGTRKNIRRLVWILVLLTLAGAAAYYWQARQQAAAQVSYQTQPAARTDLVIAVTATGTIQPLTQVDVGSELSGVVRDVLVDDNSFVKKGEILARLDKNKIEAQRTRAAAQLIAAEARVKNAQAALDLSQSTATRQLVLRGRGLSTEQEQENTTAELARAIATRDAAKADVGTAQADLSLVNADLAKIVIVSPIDGVIMKRTVEPGQTVAASLQAPVLFTIAQSLDKMQLEANVDEADVGSVKQGQAATFTVDAYRDRTFPAKVERVSFSPETVDGVVTYKTILSAPNSDLALRPGMTATARITVADYGNALTIPNEALRYTPPAAETSSGFSITQLFMPRFPRNNRQRTVESADGLRAVYILSDGTPKEVRIKPGETDGKKTLVVEGDLKAGDQLITAQKTGGTK